MKQYLLMTHCYEFFYLETTYFPAFYNIFYFFTTFVHFPHFFQSKIVEHEIVIIFLFCSLNV